MESIVKCIETGLNVPQIPKKPLNCVIGDLKAITEQFVSLLNTSQQSKKVSRQKLKTPPVEKNH